MLLPNLCCWLGLVLGASTVDIDDNYELPEDHERYNVLHIIIDDLRPELGIYRFTDSNLNPTIQTPHIDTLGRQGTIFTHAYSQFALCCPSRSSFLTSRRPDSTRVFTNFAYWRLNGGNFTTVPQYFRQYGYRTISFGKIFHGLPQTGGDDVPYSWTFPPWHANDEQLWNSQARSWYMIDGNDRVTSESSMAYHVKQSLKMLGNARDKQLENGLRPVPFYMAVGFFKPHLPFFASRQYFDMYPTNKILLANNPYVPENLPTMAWSSYGELRMYRDIASISETAKGPIGFYNTTLPSKVAKELRRAYYASVSNTDNLVGQILYTLEQCGLHRSTIVALHSDHGWHLGEHAEWSKMTNFDIATRVPLIIRVPDMDQERLVQRVVELVDVFPTLVDIAELPLLPICPEDSNYPDACTEGMSLLPLLRAPRYAHRHKTFKWEKPAFSQSFRPDGPYMGYSVRTLDYRYTKWVAYDILQFRPLWQSVVGEELYDYREDPDENSNVAHKEKYQQIKITMEEILKDGWRPLVKRDEKP